LAIYCLDIFVAKGRTKTMQFGLQFQLFFVPILLSFSLEEEKQVCPFFFFYNLEST